MAKPNYQFEKRQKELAKKRKQEEKRLQKLADKAAGGGVTEDPSMSAPPDTGDADATPRSGVSAPEAP
ncbi:hypothetical protein [Sulfurisoma sediminicola]|uniref:Uncharacterized protein n=1 Tax=Sulfurisoma sediminicola TaxID=1381557 RepID=A0A497X9Y3_9PROT|nr:hypothetical protein [Sulfurisoma sediminicola]RLJ62825.1 hypothetical protein DFR35_2643 [Sulfurisoma sediminicola]